MEGSYITAMRTGAVSGVATKHLSREDSEVIGIIGAGVQARKQLEAVREVRDIRTVLVYDSDKHKTHAFVAEASASTGLKVSVAETPSQLVQSSDIIATATTSATPVDSLDAALAEAGDIIIPLKEGVIQRENVWAELGEIVTGKKAGRTSQEEKTLFKSVGLGIQDAAVASVAFKKACSLGVGTRLDLEA
jgi:ornithine cyclodeaminase/alanine dehydrogenase